MAFKMRSPLNIDPVAKSNINKGNKPTSSFKGGDKVENTFEVEEEDGNVEVEDKITDSNTGAENNMDGDRLDAADKAIEKIDRSDSGSGNELYDYNPAMYARRKARKDIRNIRRKEREERIVRRNYGEEEAAKVRASNDKSIIDSQTYNNPEMKDEPKTTPNNDDSINDFLKNQGSSDASSKMGPPSAMTPNRAGRPINTNMLMTAPVIMTDKHSMKGAVAKLKMKNIAQDKGSNFPIPTEKPAKTDNTNVEKFKINTGSSDGEGGDHPIIQSWNKLKIGALYGDEGPAGKNWTEINEEFAKLNAKGRGTSDDEVVPQEKINKAMEALKQNKNN
jgi:hypothetical protein